MFIFFFNDTATTEIYTLSLHDALPIWGVFACSALLSCPASGPICDISFCTEGCILMSQIDRKSTRLNSSHLGISYAVFCLKKKKQDHSPLKLALVPVGRAQHDTRVSHL